MMAVASVKASVSAPVAVLSDVLVASSSLMVAPASGLEAICDAVSENGRHSVFQLPPVVSVRPVRVTLKGWSLLLAAMAVLLTLFRRLI